MRPLSKKDVENILLPEEKILWYGYPDAGLKMRPYADEVIMFFFGTYIFSFLIILEIGILVNPGKFWPSVFILIDSIPFMLLGFYFSFGRLLIESYRRKNTIYAVTTNRIIFLSKIMKLNKLTLCLATPRMVGVSEKKDGSGSIFFGAKSFFPAHFDNGKIAAWSTWNIGPFIPSFEYIDDVRRVYNLIEKAKNNIRNGN